MTVSDLESVDLYGLPLDDFTEERDKLARRLRESGRKQEAADIAAMRKPTTGAWALNQVARRHSKHVEWLIEAHKALRAAIDPDSLREASASRRRLVDQVLDTALAVLEEAGHSSSGPVRDRIARTLLAAAADPETEQALQTGTLERPAEISSQWPESPLARLIQTEKEDEPERTEEVERLESEAQARTEEAETLRREANEAKEALREAQNAAEVATRAARAAEEAAKVVREQAQHARDGRSPK